MKKPFVISVASQSGGGKTTIVTALKDRLDNSAVIYWDDYGDEVDPIRDINEWADGGIKTLLLTIWLLILFTVDAVLALC